MSDFPSITSKQIISLFEKKGYILDRIKGSHHVFFHPDTKRRTIVPFHRKDLPKGTLLEILKQAGITKEELKEWLMG